LGGGLGGMGNNSLNSSNSIGGSLGGGGLGGGNLGGGLVGGNLGNNSLGNNNLGGNSLGGGMNLNNNMNNMSNMFNTSFNGPSSSSMFPNDPFGSTNQGGFGQLGAFPGLGSSQSAFLPQTLAGTGSQSNRYTQFGR